MKWVIGAKITAVGDGSVERAGTVTDARYRLASAAPSWDSSSLYRSVLAAFTSEIGHEVDWQTGKATIGGMTLSLLPTPEVLGWLARVSFARLTTLSTVLNASGTTVVLAAQSAEDTTITIGREAICLGAETGGGPYTYSSSKRGVLGTTAYAHGTGDFDDTEAFVMGESPVHDLAVEVFRVDAAGTYTDEETVWRGIIQTVTWDGGSGLLRVSCDSAFEVLSRATICKDLWRGKLAASNAYAIYSGDAGKVPLFDSSTKLAIFSDGERIWKGEMRGGDAAGWATNVGHDIGAVYETWAEGKPVLTASPSSGRIESPPGEIWQVYSTFYGAPDLDGSSTILPANAVELALHLLTTTDHGENGAYDLGFADLGAGVLADLIDIDDSEVTRDRIGGAYAEIRQIHFPRDGKPIEVLDFIRAKLLLPFGLALVPGDGGRLTIRGLQDDAVGATSVGEADLVEPPSIRFRGIPSADAVTVEWNDRPGIGPRVDRFGDAFNRERSVSATGTTLKIDAGGVDDPETALAIGLDFTTRYHFPMPVVTFRTKRATDLVLGDVVALTHSRLPGPTGAKGVTEAIGVISSRESDLETGSIRYEFWWTSAAFSTARRVAPSARVVSYAAGVATVEPNDFAPIGYTATIDGVAYTTDAGIFEGLHALASTFKVLILDSDLSERGTAFVTAASGSGDTITTTGATVTPVAGDIIVLDDYDAVGAEEVARYAFQADATPTLGAGGDDAHEWVT